MPDRPEAKRPEDCAQAVNSIAAAVGIAGKACPAASHEQAWAKAEAAATRDLRC